MSVSNVKSSGKIYFGGFVLSFKHDSKTTLQDIDKEIEWYNQKFYIESGHWTSHPIFASRARHWLAVKTEKIRFYNYLVNYIKNKPYFGTAKILIAPVGTGNELEYLQGLYEEVHGIDISKTALSMCPAIIKTKEGDILQSGYDDNSFDIVICSLFLHHVHKVGFKPFIYYRILRKGGVLAIIEPSCLYPIIWIMSFLRAFMGNVKGLVPDEKPIYPLSLTKILKETGFKNISVRGLLFNHVCFPVLLQLLILFFNYPFRLLCRFKLFSNGIGWYCMK